MMPGNTRGRFALGFTAAGIAAAGLALTGCGPSNGSAASGSTPTASSVATTSSGTTPCSSADLGIGVGATTGTAGTSNQYIDFQNVSSHSCTLYGYPGISMLGGSPAKQVGAAAARDTNDTASLVTLAPQGYASALLKVADAHNYGSGTCHPTAVSALRIFPPDTTVAQQVEYSATGCSATSVNLLQVDTIKAGKGSPS